MPEDLKTHWDELVEYVVREYRANNQSVFLNFYHNFKDRTLELRISGLQPDWVVRRVSDDELRSGNLRTIAADLYAEARSGGEPDQPRRSHTNC